MAKYISLINWTAQGVRGYRDTLDRAEMAGKAAEQLGGSLTEIYWTLGEQDIVAILDFPDDQTATAFALAVSSQGNVRTKTSRAFDREEMRAIIDKAG